VSAELRRRVEILTCCNEGEEEKLRPDVIENSGLEFLPRERALEEGVLGHHDARTRRLEVVGSGGVRRGKLEFKRVVEASFYVCFKGYHHGHLIACGTPPALVPRRS
jgi:hypothetical protein